MSTTATRRPARGAIVGSPSSSTALGAIVRRGLRDQRRAALAWGGGFGAFGALMVAIWPSLEGSMSELVDSYPDGLKEAFGIVRLDTVERFVDAELLSLILPMALAFLAVRCVVQATVGAEDRGHLDTLLSLPVSRRVVMIASVVVTGALLAAILAVVWALTWLAGTVAGTGISASTLASGLGNVWPLAMVFAGLAALVAGLAHRPSTATCVASGTLVAMYAIDLVGKLADAAEPLRWISAFRYYGSAIQQGFDVGHVAVLTVAALVLTIAGAALFERRDVL
ncbi:MAG: ABC transporter permease subunit [Solirubrobacteraceae bacterium]|nr:ABC transporter permease subunit [Solirubrobacteraceae bacterium]